MKTSFRIKFPIFIIAVLSLTSCKQEPHFTIEGKITGADTTMLYLEQRSLTETKIIDSVKLNSDGNFKFKKAALGYSEFFLLKIGDQAINLAVDSIETITVNAARSTFSTDYIIDGSESSLKIKDIVFSQQKLSLDISSLRKKYEKKEITQEEYVSAVQQSVNDYKAKTKTLILSDYKGMSSYFALFQKVDNYLIFDPYNKSDLVVFRAVATVWDQYKSKSPRAEQLKSFTLSALAELRQMEKQEDTLKKIENTESSDQRNYYEISLPDISSNIVKLSSMRGKVVILDFSAYQTKFSPAHNILINNIYSKNKGIVDVYQVSFDTDEHAWKNTAINLPWTCVRDDRYLNSDLLSKFNVQEFPTTFLINKNGDIVKRILPSDNLASEVQKLL